MPRTRDVRQEIDAERAPFFVLLEGLGRSVLRPGGRVATGRLLDGVGVGGGDVVELAAGVGATAAQVLSRGPRSYTAVEPEQRFAERLREAAGDAPMRHVRASAGETGLDDGCADVVIGEAILTMQGEEARRAIVGEAARLLRPGGRYGIHELATLVEDPADVRALQRDLSQVVRVSARPVPADEWCAVLRDAGLEIVAVERFPMRLLTLRGLADDEGVRGAMRVLGRVARWPAARRRVRRARRVHRDHGASLTAVVVIARRPPDGGAPAPGGPASAAALP